MYSSIQKLLVERLPKLSELSFGCEVRVIEKLDTCSHYYDAQIVGWKNDELFNDCYIVMGISLLPGHDVHKSHVIKKSQITKILGHPFTHADILEGLSIVQNRPFLMDNKGFLYEIEGEEIVPMEIDKLPKDLHDLDKPEYKDTAEKIISLLTQ